MSSLKFKDYFLNELSYKRNSNFDPSVEVLNLKPELSAAITIVGDSKAYINLNTKQGDISLTDSAFELVVDIVGEFEFDYDPSEYDIKFENFLTENGLAILWSYIRPMVSDMITRGNEFPNFILPVINIQKMLKDNDSLVIKYKEED
ncbi:preprotein translocase subunit SecB [Streptococcus sp. 10F2]